MVGCGCGAITVRGLGGTASVGSHGSTCMALCFPFCFSIFFARSLAGGLIAGLTGRFKDVEAPGFRSSAAVEIRGVVDISGTLDTGCCAVGAGLGGGCGTISGSGCKPKYGL